MKALTLIQPWATLVTIGAKRVETRSWKTNYRGALAIHAGKTRFATALNLAWKEPFRSAMAPVYLPEGGAGGYVYWFGAVVAVCRLTKCRIIDSAFEKPPEPEASFGNYSPGRYAWFLDDVVKVDPPIPAKGAQGLWGLPPEVEAELKERGLVP